MKINPLIVFLYKDFLLELKTRSALGGILLYLVSTVFICYMAFDGIISARTWNALFWIILLFTSFNAVMKGFTQDSRERFLYYFSIISPIDFINSKIIYNTLLLLVLAFTALGVFILFMGSIINSISSFIFVIITGVLGISSLLTMLSAIASKARNNFTLLAVLSFPIFLPQLIVLLKASENAINGDSILYIYPELAISLLISLIAVVLSNILFPYIWQE